MEETQLKTHQKKAIFLIDDDWPASKRSSAKMMFELARTFADDGYSSVLLMPSNGPQKHLISKSRMEGVELWRYRCPNARGKSKLRRAFIESQYALRALMALWLTQPKDALRFDICVNHAPSIFFGPLAGFLNKRGAFTYLVLRDFFPQWAIDEGLLRKNALSTRYLQAFERLTYRNAHKIGLQSQANIAVFESLHPQYQNHEVLVNWADVAKTKTKTKQAPSHLIKELAGPLAGKTVFFYGGNMGHAQDIPLLLQLVIERASDKRSHFLFVGHGDHFDLVRRTINDKALTNITLLPAVDQQDYDQLLDLADIGLLSLSGSHIAHNFPGKVIGYMTKSLPILGSVNPGNDLADIINDSGSGLICESGDLGALTENASLLAKDAGLRGKMGRKAHKLLQTSFSATSAKKTIERAFMAHQDGL